jgi:phosphomannomutase
MKKLIVFDLDGTLAQSKASLDEEMAKLFDKTR